MFNSFLHHDRKTHVAPIPAYNGHKNKACCIVIRVAALPADNPMQAEEASHMLGSLRICRQCEAGGPKPETESDAGFHALHIVCICDCCNVTFLTDMLYSQDHCATLQVSKRHYGIKSRRQLLVLQPL
jgi:hypothetical protein